MSNELEGFLTLTNGVNVTEQEYQSILKFFSDIVKNESFGVKEKAVYLRRTLSSAIKNKLAGNVITSIDYCNTFPSTDKTKAGIIRGMFFTFLEQENGLPGFVKIVKGISSSLLGIGSVSFYSSSFQTNFKVIKKIIDASDGKTLSEYQSKILRYLIEQDAPSRYQSIERGISCIIMAAAFFPIYAALSSIKNGNDSFDENDLNEGYEIIIKKFSPDSKELSKLFNQTMFAQLFNSLFSNESTVLSIFTI